MRESWWRIDRRAGPNQFFRRSHQLLVAITFDPELRLTRGLRLREALVALFTTITHAKHGEHVLLSHFSFSILLNSLSLTTSSFFEFLDMSSVGEMVVETTQLE
ncbi:hypothetical protein PIB30_051530 [Stylosanthes scabra]|uniref:Uncharacterized protein n=1 Tax=Stylosanthes scabra TaxID=79078 RepID=A0ABU6UGM3_9FABA|nr:hypothetical protein [Stylosanthes scabra]